MPLDDKQKVQDATDDKQKVPVTVCTMNGDRHCFHVDDTATVYSLLAGCGCAQAFGMEPEESKFITAGGDVLGVRANVLAHGREFYIANVSTSDKHYPIAVAHYNKKIMERSFTELQREAGIIPPPLVSDSD